MGLTTNVYAASESQPIKARNALFIKLGAKGFWEKECIEHGYLKLGYHDIRHDDCIKGDWDAVNRFYLQEANSKQQAASAHLTQIKYFYTESQDTLWFTFFNQCLWWCFSKDTVTFNADKTKTRPVIGKWNNRDVRGNLLLLDNISGSLLKTQGFRGTICGTDELEYLLNKINSIESPEIIKTKQSLSALETSVMKLVAMLQPKDFEVLVDLIFRQSGWQRMGVVGKTQKDIDLDLMMPVTGERAFVQIKSQSNEHEFNEYLDQFNEMVGYDHFFYVVHSPSNDLLAIDRGHPRLMTGPKIASMVVRAGLTDWLMKKVG